MSKYHRTIKGATVDVYDILLAFGVTCPARQHAIKKLLMPGERGTKNTLIDLGEAKQAIDRAIELLVPDLGDGGGDRQCTVGAGLCPGIDPSARQTKLVVMRCENELRPSQSLCDGCWSLAQALLKTRGKLGVPEICVVSGCTRETVADMPTCAGHLPYGGSNAD